MNCLIHQNVTAVSQCSKCGVGMCSDCVNSSEYSLDGKPLCRDCNHQLINDLISDDRSLKLKTTIKLVLNAVFLILGLLVCLEDPMNGIFICAIGGIPTAWKMLSPSEREKAQNYVDDKIADMDGVGGGLVNSFVRLLVRVLLTVVIGAVAAPILLIINIVKLVKCNKRINENTILLEQFVRA